MDEKERIVHDFYAARDRRDWHAVRQLLAEDVVWHEGMVVVGGFAGLGLMHAPAAGLLASELILDGEIRSVNPADVSLARFSRPIESVERTGF